VKVITRLLTRYWGYLASLPIRRWGDVSGCPRVTVSSRRWPADRARSGHVVCCRARRLAARRPGPRQHPATYALRACHLRCSRGSKPVLASSSRVTAAGGGRWLLMAVRGHRGALS